MKTSEKVAGVISIMLIIGVLFYLYNTNLIFTLDPDVISIVALLFFLSIFSIILYKVYTASIVKSRINGFASLSNRYSLKHTFVNSLFFIPYGKVNQLSGKINKVTVEVFDEYVTEDLTGLTFEFLWNLFTSYYLTNSSDGSSDSRDSNNRTKIIIDGKEVISGPFMKIKDIEGYLDGVRNSQ